MVCHFLARRGFRIVDSNRRAHGLRPGAPAINHTSIRKPWRIVRSNSTLPDTPSLKCGGKRAPL
eukprot:4301701-Lingulodinium_polyedra.AAC.1